MGFLHEGHLSLVRKSKELCNITVVSLFVNPIQFSPSEDLEQYPRDIERDKKLLIDEGVDYLFMPETDQIYTKNFQTYVNVEEVTLNLEGQFRPTHFRGVTTIVNILFNCVKPDYAFFGQKDAQQAAVIKRMVDDLKIRINLVICPIVREADGLAMMDWQ
jgi:pantoate--beta-alanine ligase